MAPPPSAAARRGYACCSSPPRTRSLFLSALVILTLFLLTTMQQATDIFHRLRTSRVGNRIAGFLRDSGGGSLLHTAASSSVRGGRNRRLRESAEVADQVREVLDVGPGLSAGDVAALIEIHEAGDWDKVSKGRIDPVKVYEAARVQALTWQYRWKHRHVDLATNPSGKVQILFIGTAEDFFMRIDRVFYDVVEVAMTNPYLNVTIWGPGWHGWEGGRERGAFESNMRRMGWCDSFDIILFHEESFGADRCGNSKRAIIVQEIGDCPWQCIKFFTPLAHVVTNMYASGIREFFNMDARIDLTDRRRLFAHNPHCVDPAKFFPAPWKPRQAWAEINHTVTLSGAIHGSWYPLRTALAAGASDRGMNVTVINHKGWIVPFTSNPDKPRVVDVNDPRVQRVMNVQKDFAQMMQGAAVCAFDSKSIKVLLRKYPEAMMTGCPILSDLPGELQDVVKPAMFEVPFPLKPGMALKTYVNEAIQDERGRALKGAYGMLAALEQLTCHTKVDRWLDLVEMYRDGGRGYLYPFMHQVGCAKYLGHSSPHNWCDAGDG